MPEPDVVSLEIVTDALPVFASLIVCVESVPTVTLPKLTDAGVTVNDDSLPDPVHSAVNGFEEAVLVTATAPDTVEVLVGLKVAVTCALWPAAIVAGVLTPETVISAPVTEISEIVAFEFPVFVIFTVWVAVVPTVTAPKFNDEGESDREAVTPPPFKGIAVGESSALLVIVTTPVVAPLVVALNATFNVAVCPEAKVFGAVSPPIV